MFFLLGHKLQVLYIEAVYTCTGWHEVSRRASYAADLEFLQFLKGIAKGPTQSASLFQP